MTYLRCATEHRHRRKDSLRAGFLAVCYKEPDVRLNSNNSMCIIKRGKKTKFLEKQIRKSLSCR